MTNQHLLFYLFCETAPSLLIYAHCDQIIYPILILTHTHLLPPTYLLPSARQVEPHSQNNPYFLQASAHTHTPLDHPKAMANIAILQLYLEIMTYIMNVLSVYSAFRLGQCLFYRCKSAFQTRQDSTKARAANQATTESSNN
ncbi:MAG: hypothetical protein MHMPM18_003220 [Marteilia pararefringens]